MHSYIIHIHIYVYIYKEQAHCKSWSKILLPMCYPAGRRCSIYGLFLWLLWQQACSSGPSCGMVQKAMCPSAALPWAMGASRVSSAAWCFRQGSCIGTDTSCVSVGLLDIYS